MTKKHEEKAHEEKAHEEKEPAPAKVPAKEVVAEDPSGHKAFIGQAVHFTRQVPQSNGSTQLEKLAAIVSGLNPPGSFQKKDHAVSLWVFPAKPGAAPEARHGIMHSEQPADGRWSAIG